MAELTPQPLKGVGDEVSRVGRSNALPKAQDWWVLGRGHLGFLKLWQVFFLVGPEEGRAGGPDPVPLPLIIPLRKLPGDGQT